MKTFLRTFLFVQAILIIASLELNAQTFEWVKPMSPSTGSFVYGKGLAINSRGNSFVTGVYNDTATFDTIQLYGGGMYVAKYSPSGKCLWAKTPSITGGTTDACGYNIAIDAKDNSYVVGNFTGTLSFGSIQITSYGNTDIFTAKFDSNGVCLWAKNAGGITSDRGYAVTADENGNCYITGNCTGPATFGTYQLSGYGNYDMFIAKYDQTGNCLWAKQAGGTASDYGFGVSVDAYGNIYIGGAFNGAATFGTIQLTSYGLNDIFLAKYDPIGNCLWVKQAGSTTHDLAYALAFDSYRNSYLTGQFSGTATFGTYQITSHGLYDIFTAKYDSSGNCLWVKDAGGNGQDFGNGIATDSKGNCYISGSFRDTSTFGNVQLMSQGSSDICVIKYDANGNFLWVRQAGGTGPEEGNAIAADINENCYFIGDFTAPAAFGNIQFTTGGSGGFVAKIANVPVPVEMTAFTYKANNSSIKLEWKTVTETNNDRFEIERKGVKAGWAKIGEMKGAGSSTLPRQYSFVDNGLSYNGKYYYRLKQVDFNGGYKYSNEIEAELNFTPKEYSLEQNFPNPFNPSTVIKYSLPFDSDVRLVIYNSLGQSVRELGNGLKAAGTHEVNFNASSLSSGVYFYSIQANSKDGKQNYTATKKMLLVK